MPKVSGRRMWHAEVELEIEHLALAAQYLERGSGSKQKRYLTATDWLDNGKIMLDVGKRLKGWLKEQVKTMKSSMLDRVQYGVVCKSLPKAGYIPVATLNDIAPSRNWSSFQYKDDYELNELPEPNVEVVITEKGTSIFSLYYVLEKPVTVKASIYSFAYGINPENIEEWLRILGQTKGLGDRHSSSSGYGCFTVKDFKMVEEKELNF